VLAFDRLALEAASSEFDHAIRRTDDIDHFCSSSAWTFSADRALMPPRPLFARRTDDGWAALARVEHEAGRWSLEPLEAAWCLASPLACTGDAGRFTRDLAAELARHTPDDVLFLAGLVEPSALFRALVAALASQYHLSIDVVPQTRRFRASLRGGVDGFLTRRSPTFRTRLRQASQRATRSGVSFEPVTAHDGEGAAALYARLLALEARSWKGMEGEGLAVPQMRAFYAEMLPRLARTGAIRAHVGTLDGKDVAMIVGGVVATPEGLVYRGLQFSFDDAHRSLSLGNLAQLAQIASLADEGVVLYDLGSEVDYKRRWGELCLETVTLVAVPRRA
jgi:hypothetical protein